VLLVGPTAASRLEVSQALFRIAGLSPRIGPVPTSAFPTPARRALNAELDTTRLKTVFGTELTPWRDALAKVVAHMDLTQGAAA